MCTQLKLHTLSNNEITTSVRLPFSVSGLRSLSILYYCSTGLFIRCEEQRSRFISISLKVEEKQKHSFESFLVSGIVGRLSSIHLEFGFIINFIILSFKKQKNRKKKQKDEMMKSIEMGKHHMPVECHPVTAAQGFNADHHPRATSSSELMHGHVPHQNHFHSIVFTTFDPIPSLECVLSFNFKKRISPFSFVQRSTTTNKKSLLLINCIQFADVHISQERANLTKLPFN